MRAAELEGREYVPLTARGEAMHVAWQIRSVFEELHQGAEHPRED